MMQIPAQQAKERPEEGKYRCEIRLWAGAGTWKRLLGRSSHIDCQRWVSSAADALIRREKKQTKSQSTHHLLPYCCRDRMNRSTG
jgi:hypothetical protein